MNADAPAPPDLPLESTAEMARKPRSGIRRVLVVALVGAVLVGSAGFAVSTALTPDAPIPQTMCLDTTCTYAMSADTGMSSSPPAKHASRSAPERFFRKVLYVCHIGR